MTDTLLLDTGTRYAVGGDAPFLLNEDAVWLVHSGRLDIFAVPVADGRPSGARIHVTRVGAGQAAFGVDPAPAGAYGLLAVAGSGTQLVRVDGSAVRARATDVEWSGAIRAGIEHWVDLLCGALSQTVPPPRYAELGPGASVVLTRGDAVRASGVQWVTARGPVGAACVANQPELALEGDAPMPLSARAWVMARDAVTIETIDLDAAWRRGGTQWAAEAWRGVGRLHAMLLRRVATSAAEAADDERERQRRKAAADRVTVSRACQQLLQPFHSAKETDLLTSTGVSEEDPLLAACRLVGGATHITIRPYPAGHGIATPRDPLAAIARASRARIRRVALRNRWWTADNGPLIATMADDGHPVALLLGKRGYELCEPGTGRRTTVTEAVAGTLKPFAHSFYRPFPDHPLSARDVIRFGFLNCHRDLWMVVLMGVVGALLGLIPSVATGWIFNTVIPGAERTQLGEITVVLIICAVTAAMFTLVRGLAMLRLEGKMGSVVQAAVWDRLLSLPMPFFRPFTSGDLAVRAMGIDQIRQVISGSTVTAIIGGIFSLFSFALMFWYSTDMAWRASLLILLALLVTAGGGALQLRPQRGVITQTAQSSGTVLQLLTSVSKLRVAAAEVQAFARWARGFGRQRTLQFQVRAIGSVMSAFNAAFPLVAYIVIFWIALDLMTAPGPATAGAMRTGDFLAFLSAFGNGMASLLSTTAAVLSAFNVIPLYEQARPILAARPEVDRAKVDPGPLSGDIEFQHVMFRYRPEGPLVLRDVSFEVAPGEFVAFVGPSGSGKSTVLRLLLGFEIPEAGLIYYDGQDLAGLDVQAVRRQMGAVLQSGRLLSGDLFTNIVGSSSATFEDAWESARMAGLADDIEAMPMGMHTVVSEGGGTLSGGQRQRLLIARAIVQRPRILFFDEATSALDNRTQEIVGASLARLRAARIVVAHRLTTIMNADRIYVMQGGRIVQTGTFNSLLAQPGLFAELAQRQLA
jgi:NHLM bacteriocin system ABC transporter ATP-binding protein